MAAKKRKTLLNGLLEALKSDEKVPDGGERYREDVLERLLHIHAELIKR